MKNAERFGLDEKTIVAIGSVLQKYPSIEKAIIYGSRAKGTHREGSDIDLTIVGPKLTTENLLAIENEIDELLLPYKFDLSLFHHIDNPNVIDHIRRVGKPLWP